MKKILLILTFFLFVNLKTNAQITNEEKNQIVWVKDVPTNTINRQYDQPGLPGHMTVTGCQLWANNMLPFVKEVMKARNIQ